MAETESIMEIIALYIYFIFLKCSTHSNCLDHTFLTLLTLKNMSRPNISVKSYLIKTKTFIMQNSLFVIQQEEILKVQYYALISTFISVPEAHIMRI